MGCRILGRIALAIAFCAATLRSAPLGTAFVYQGQLKENGAPANGVFDFRFRLLSQGSVTLQEQCAIQVNVVNGLFTADVDFGAAVFDGSALSMQLFVKHHIPHEIEDCTTNTIPDPYTPLSPVQPLAPAPYAIHALSAPNGHALDAADGSPTEALVVDNDGDVGIGTIPATGENLHVKGDARFDGPDGIGVHNPNPANTGAIARLSWLNDVARIRWGGLSPGGSNGFDFQKIGDISLLRILDNGNVGIGTTTPGSKLEVVAAFNGDGIRVTGSTTTGTKSPGFHLFDSVAQRGSLGLAESNSAFSTDAAAGDIVLRSNTGKLLLQNGSGASAVAISGNNVGIGTTAPSARLHVVGDVMTTGDFLYSAAQTRHFSIPIRAFAPFSHDMPWTVLPTGAGDYLTSSSFGGGVAVELAAPVYLPDGAAVTEFRAHMIDDTTDFDITVSLRRAAVGNSPPSVMASVSSSGAPGPVNLADSTISSPTIDNSQFVYWVQANWNNSADVKIDLGPVRITYTVPGP